MNRVNPLYLGLLLVVVLGVSVFKLNSAKVELIQAKKSYTETAKLATELSALQSVYKNQKKLQAKLKKILANGTLRGASIVSKYKKNNVKLSAESIDKKALNYLFAKLFNATFNITSFEVKKLSDEKASFKMEIQW